VTLTLELPNNRGSVLKAKAEAQGVTAEEYAQQIINRELDQQQDTPEPFWKAFTRHTEALPDEVLDSLPADGASEHDHYLYGSPKRNS
jgi:hypothetical protein